PRVPLGKALAKAEESGTLQLQTKDGAIEIVVPKLGGYSKTWPLNCAKSKAIIEANAKFIAESQDEEGAYHLTDGRAIRNDIGGCLAGLFLLSTGNNSYLPPVTKQAHVIARLAENRKNAGGHINWQLGYQGILLSEYYLRTGDKVVLPGLQELCNWCAENQAAGGWGHGAPVGPGYVQSGLMNHAGIPILITLILAQECGVKVDPGVYSRAVKLMYRMTGHGCISYGDHRSELWWSNTNGRNAMVACAFSLLSEVPRYRAASEHLATLVADSYHQPEFGHTGGGFNVMWRGMASVHVPKERASHYRRQLDTLAWYYDLVRQPSGGFSMLATPPDNKRYVGLNWGTGAVGLTYTAPLKTLRITGKPPGEFSQKVAPPDFEWGTEADLAFFKTTDAEGFGMATVPPHEVYALLLKDRQKKVTVPFCAQQLLSYSPLVRSWAGKRLREIGSPEAIAALVKAATHEDPRVRRAVYDAVSGYDNWRRPMNNGLDRKTVSKEFLPSILRTLDKSSSAWWEIDGALFALGRAEPDDIRAQWKTIERFAKHDDWYLRDAAFWAAVGLHETITGDEFQFLTEVYENSQHVFERASYDGGFRTILKTDKVAFDRVTMTQAVQRLGKTTHDPEVMLGYGVGGIHEAAHRTMMVLKHFDPEVYSFMVGDFVTYLENWEPYYQHSVWLISGSKWQLGILKVVDSLGADAKPIVASLKTIAAKYSLFDAKRIGNGGKDLEAQINEAIRKWEADFGPAS
ncbi:MAG: DUF6288 domain-containing protein, partial [Verrucomicrobiota bacterium]